MFGIEYCSVDVLDDSAVFSQMQVHAIVANHSAQSRAMQTQHLSGMCRHQIHMQAGLNNSSMHASVRSERRLYCVRWIHSLGRL